MLTQREDCLFCRLAREGDFVNQGDGLVAIAAVNGPAHIVVSGVAASVDGLVDGFAAAGVRVQRLAVSHAFHSPLMDPMLAAFAEAAGAVSYGAPQRRVISNHDGQVIGREMADPQYWLRHVREPVQFAAGIETLQRAVGIPALSPGWQTSLRELLDEAENGTPVGSAAAEPAWEGFRALQVIDVVPETATVSSLYIADPDGGGLPAARPGQYLSVRVPTGGPGAVRSYSLSSAPGADTYRISVKREEHGRVSRWLHANVRAGTVIEAAAPRAGYRKDEQRGGE